MQPSTGLCHTRQKNTEKISGHASNSEEDKIEALTGISKFHHFRFNKSYPGKAFYKEHADATEEEFQMLKDASILPPCLLPPQVLPSGLDDKRRRYLHKEIREF
ncbi:unnamed protein product, partial [Porites evermanni]